MDHRFVNPNLGYWVEYKLEKDIIDFLWERIDDAKKISSDVEDTDLPGEVRHSLYPSHKHLLAGNISRSLRLEDKDSYFDNFMNTAVKIYENKDINSHVSTYWVNFQKKHEFNPIHTHDRDLSFVIWLKIPTSWEDQCKLSFLDGIQDHEKKVSNFEFIMTNMLGKIEHYQYHLNPSMEGCMILFPSKLNHQVYPFYESDEERISVSGNVTLELNN